MPSIGQNIKKYRKLKGMTQSELAKGVGISQNTLSSYESGKISPPIEKIEKIAEVLEVASVNLIYDDQKERQDEPKKKGMVEDFVEMHNLKLSDQEYQDLAERMYTRSADPFMELFYFLNKVKADTMRYIVDYESLSDIMKFLSAAESAADILQKERVYDKKEIRKLQQELETLKKEGN